MFSRRIFLLFAITLSMVTTASAQGGWGTKMANKGQTTAAQITANAQSSQDSNDDRDDDGDNDRALSGTWRTIETFPDGFSAKVLFTFGAGKRDGIVVHSDELFLVPAPSCITAQGVWKRTGERRFIATDEGFCFDTFGLVLTPPTFPSFAPAGKIKFDSAIKLNHRGNEFDGTLHVTAFDVDGNLVFTADGTLHGVRMRAEAPPQ